MPSSKDPSRPDRSSVAVKASTAKNQNTRPALADGRPVPAGAAASASIVQRLKILSGGGRLKAILLFLPPALVLFTMFVTLPVIEAAFYSFYNWNGYGSPTKVIGLENYARVLNDPIFYQSLLNNVWVVLVSAFVQVPLALWLALLISDKSRSSLAFRAIFFLPYVLGEIVAGLIWRYMYDGNYGVVAHISQFFGTEAPQVLATEGWAEAAILLVVVWKYFGFHMALFIAGRQSVPDDVLESAQIDGASRAQVTFRIVLPLMRPVIILSLFFSILGSLQFFSLIVPLTDGGPSNSTHSAVSYLYTFGIKRMRVGYGSAVGVTLFIICVLVMLIYKRLFMREKATR
jgi:raffinose/stachyose/melibiose transport system permease protein